MSVNVVLYGIDPTTGDVYPVNIDASGHIQIDVLSVPTVNVNTHGWINGAWQKNPLLHGASGNGGRAFNNTNLAAGLNSLDDNAVPNGEIWEVTNVVFIYFGTSPTRVYVRVKIGGQYYTVYAINNPASATRYDKQGKWTLYPGDLINVYVEGATAGDDLYCEAIYERTDIDQ